MARQRGIARQATRAAGNPSSPTIAAAPITLAVSRIDARALGRGLAHVGGAHREVLIPGVLPGETVEVRLQRQQGERLEGEPLRIIAAAPGRRSPPCRHFGTCGGCAMQHWPDDAYGSWKVERIVQALQARGATPQQVLPLVRTGPGTRRRADFSLLHTRRGAIVGFARRASHEIVNLDECPVLLPALAELIAALRGIVPALLPPGGAAEAIVNATDTGADLLLVPGGRLPLDLERRELLAWFAHAADLARLSWGTRRAAETVAMRRAPRLRLGSLDVEPPPGAFLQASRISEAALQAAVRDWLGAAARVVDLYGGIGTLSLGLLPQRRVTVIEGDRAAVTAIRQALRQAALGGVADAIVRDLARNPLTADELKPFDAAILDPPRAGAPAQAAELARSGVPTVVAVSCDPVSFARDARTLADGGYRLERLLPVDQFLWSPHVELAALFQR